MIADMKVVFARIPTPLYMRMARAAMAKDLKIAAVVKQAIELWLKERAK